jgi:hypothetical protein
MDVVIEKEPFTLELFQELLPLAQKCWEESTVNKAETCAYYGERDFQIDPDTSEYQRLADLGSVVLVTLRDGGVAKGYVVGFLYRSWHHRKILCGNGDSIYIEPGYRSYTAVMAERFEKEFFGMGAEIIGWPTHVNGPVYEILKSRGYVGDDVLMEKRLCA